MTVTTFKSRHEPREPHMLCDRPTAVICRVCKTVPLSVDCGALGFNVFPYLIKGLASVCVMEVLAMAEASQMCYCKVLFLGEHHYAWKALSCATAAQSTSFNHSSLLCQLPFYRSAQVPKFQEPCPGPISIVCQPHSHSFASSQGRATAAAAAIECAAAWVLEFSSSCLAKRHESSSLLSRSAPRCNVVPCRPSYQGSCRHLPALSCRR